MSSRSSKSVEMERNSAKMGLDAAEEVAGAPRHEADRLLGHLEERQVVVVVVRGHGHRPRAFGNRRETPKTHGCLMILTLFVTFSMIFAGSSKVFTGVRLENLRWHQLRVPHSDHRSLFPEAKALRHDPLAVLLGALPLHLAAADL